MNKVPTPPQWAQQFFAWFCKAELWESLSGDLEEEFIQRANEKGLSYAKRVYVFQVLSFLRPFAIKKGHLFNPSIMLRHHLKISLRNIVKDKWHSLLKITGLSLGMSVCLLLLLYVNFEFSFDQYHQHSDRIYRVETIKVNINQAYPGTPTGMVSLLRDQVSGIEKVAPVQVLKEQLITIKTEDKKVQYKESIAFVDPFLFELFDYPWIKGKTAFALSNPDQVVLSESYAKKLFSHTDVIGRTLTLAPKVTLTVSGVIADPPPNSDFRFHVMCSYPTLQTLDSQFNFSRLQGWTDRHQTYVLLAEGVQPERIQGQFPSLIEQFMGEEALAKRAYTLALLSEVHFNYNLSFRNVNKWTLHYLWIGGICMLFIACVNFINLSSIQAMNRLKEIGIRKVLGSGQFQTLSLLGVQISIIVFMSMLIAMGIATGTFLRFLRLFNIQIETTAWESALFMPNIIFVLLLVWILLTGVSLLYPALMVLSVKITDAIRNKYVFRSTRFSIMHLLTIFQFALSSIFIFGALVMGRQLNYVDTASLGFQAEDVVTLRLPSTNDMNPTVLKDILLDSPFIEAASFSNNSPSSESNFMSNVQFLQDGTDELIVSQMKFISEEFLKMFQIELLAGESLEAKDTTNGFILVNEVMVNRMGLSSVYSAVGKELRIGENVLSIKGIVRDFHVNSLHQQIDPTVLIINPNRYGQLNLKLGEVVQQSEVHPALGHVKNVWQAKFPEAYFEYEYLAHTLRQAYGDELLLSQLVKGATIMVLIIACFGLIGLSSSILKRKWKEMAIRKVLGATSRSIFFLLVQRFVVISLFSLLLSLPTAYLILHRWLENFAFRISILPWMYALVSCMIILAIVLTISYQSYQLSLANPANTLKNE